jgi:hypothetical protein
MEEPICDLSCAKITQICEGTKHRVLVCSCLSGEVRLRR